MLTPIYVRLPNWVGDACMALPALHLLRTAGFQLILIGRPWARDLLAGLEPVDFIALKGPLRNDVEIVRQHVRTGGSARLGRTPAGPPPRGICFPDSISSALIFRLAGIQAGGYRDEGRSFLLRWPARKPREDLHVVESYYYLARSILSRWGVQAELPTAAGSTLELPLTRAHEQAALATIELAGLEQPFVLLSPTATGLHRGRVKSWPHYEQLAQALISAGWAVAMCPPPSEVDAARHAAPSAQLLPSLPLGAYAALTRLAALVICNDSGTSHVAAAAQSRQLTLFGVTRPERTRPWSPRALWLGNETGWPSLEEVTVCALDALQLSSPPLYQRR